MAEIASPPERQSKKPWFGERETRSVVAWWNVVLRTATPQWAQRVTRVSATVIRDIAFYQPNDGDSVRIVSRIGSIRCRVRSWEGTVPGMASKCFGQGHWTYGRIAALDFDHDVARGNANEIIPAEYERLTDSTARHGGATRVRIERT